MRSTPPALCPVTCNHYFNHTIAEIVISKHALPIVNGIVCEPRQPHALSDLRTMQEIFRVGSPIRDAANATDRSDHFNEGAIPLIPHF